MVASFFLTVSDFAAYSVREGGGNMKISQGCTATLGSVTVAMRAQDALARAAIPTNVIKEESSRGCVYSISFSCTQINNVKTVLEHERIRVREWKTDK